jgi:hypothetical protein
MLSRQIGGQDPLSAVLDETRYFAIFALQRDAQSASAADWFADGQVVRG